MEKARVAIVAAAMALALIIGAGASAAPENAYTVTNLVSDQAGVAAHQDPSLVNAWGLAASPGTDATPGSPHPGHPDLR